MHKKNSPTFCKGRMFQKDGKFYEFVLLNDKQVGEGVGGAMADHDEIKIDEDELYALTNEYQYVHELRRSWIR